MAWWTICKELKLPKGVATASVHKVSLQDLLWPSSRIVQAASRLASLYVECGLFAAAEHVLSDMEAAMLSRAENIADVRKRIIDARFKAASRRHADHYKLLGLKQSCTTDEVIWAKLPSPPGCSFPLCRHCIKM